MEWLNALKSFWYAEDKDGSCNVEDLKKLPQDPDYGNVHIRYVQCGDKKHIIFSLPLYVVGDQNFNFNKRNTSLHCFYKITGYKQIQDRLIIENKAQDFSKYASLSYLMNVSKSDNSEAATTVLKGVSKLLRSGVINLHIEDRCLGPIHPNMIFLDTHTKELDERALIFVTLYPYRLIIQPRERNERRYEDIYRIFKMCYELENRKTIESNPKNDIHFINYVSSNSNLTVRNNALNMIHKLNDEEYKELWNLERCCMDRKDALDEKEAEMHSTPNPQTDEKTPIVVSGEKKSGSQPREEKHNSLPRPLDPLEETYNNLAPLSDEQKEQIRLMLRVLSRGAILELKSNEDIFTAIGKQIEEAVPAVKVLEFWLSNKEIFGYLRNIKQADSLAWNGLELNIPFVRTKKPGFKDKFIKQMDDKSIADTKMTNAEEIIQYYDILQKRVHVKIDDLKSHLIHKRYEDFINNLFVKGFEKRNSPSEQKASEAYTLVRKVRPEGSRANSSEHKSDPRVSRANSSERDSRKSAQSTGILPDESYPCDVPATTRLHCIKECKSMSNVPYPFRVRMNFREGRSKCYNIQTLYEYRDSLVEFKWWKDHPNSFMKNQRDFIEQRYKWLHEKQVVLVFKTFKYLLDEIWHGSNNIPQLSYDEDGEMTDDQIYIKVKDKKNEKQPEKTVFTQTHLKVGNRRYLKTRLFLGGKPVLEINGCGYNGPTYEGKFEGKFSLFSSKFDYQQNPIAIANTKRGERIKKLVAFLKEQKRYRDSFSFYRVSYVDVNDVAQPLILPFGLV